LIRIEWQLDISDPDTMNGSLLLCYYSRQLYSMAPRRGLEITQHKPLSHQNPALSVYRRFDNPQVSGNYSAMSLHAAALCRLHEVHEALSGACVFRSPTHKRKPLTAELAISTAAKGARLKTKTKLCGLSPRANYIDQATADCRLS
jgi:hypothetical protein